MFEITNEELVQLGAIITANEIRQQPKLWEETLKNYLANKSKIDYFLATISKSHETVRVIFTGAGTSAYVGDTVVPYLKGKVDVQKWNLMSVPTTDIVSNPYHYLSAEIPTLMISFARSGNSPESLAATHLGQQLVKDFYQLTITCASAGKLAQQAVGDEHNLLLLMPAASNDKGFAMTSSYTCMALSTLLVFDPIPDDEKQHVVKEIVAMGQNMIKREAEIQSIVSKEFNRIVYVGSGSLVGVAREASLKILELTAGKVATLFDSSLGFRHGPKSFVDEKTLFFTFASNEGYTKQYDWDILKEVFADQVATHVCGLTTLKDETFGGEQFIFATEAQKMPDAYLALPYVMFAQIFSVMVAIKLGNKPDTPSPTGTVNRVVQGVTIYPY